MTLLNLLNYELSWHDRERWDETIYLMERFVEENKEDIAPLKENARIIKYGIDEVDSFIQQNTAAVCPFCESVCCINRHGYYDYEDLIYIFSLGEKPPRYKEGVLDADSCQFTSVSGCTIERSIRPFRCNWYFCNSLLEHIEKGAAKPYRSFLRRFDEIMELRNGLLDGFFGMLKSI